MSDKKPEIVMGFEIVPNKAMEPGTLLIVPNKEDLSINDIWMVTGIDDKGENKLEPFKPIPREMTRDEYCLDLIMRLVQSSKSSKKEEYNVARKEIKRLWHEDKEAREFFKIAFCSVKF